VTFEVFNYAVYTGAVKIDDARDTRGKTVSAPIQEPWLNSGNTSRSNAPELSAKLLDQMDSTP